MPIDEKTAKEEFDRDGFVVFRDFFSEEEVARLDAALRRYAEEVVPTLPRGEAMFDTRGNARMPKNLSNMQKFDPFFACLLNDPRMLKLARTLLGDEPIPQHISHLNKAPRIGTESVPHQDGAYGNLVPNEGLTIWIPLDRADEGNGCSMPSIVLVSHYCFERCAVNSGSAALVGRGF
jgi:phytanoyl-CoA hydroxylase